MRKLILFGVVVLVMAGCGLNNGAQDPCRSKYGKILPPQNPVNEIQINSANSLSPLDPASLRKRYRDSPSSC